MGCLGLVVILLYQEVNFSRSVGKAREELAGIYEAVSRLLLGPLAESASPSERTLARKPIGSWSPADRMNAGWNMESLCVMAWALRLIDVIPPFDTQFEELGLLDSVNSLSKIEALKGRVALRSHADLDRFETEAERWHWRARQAEALFAHGEPSLRQRGLVGSAVGKDARLFGKPYEQLRFEEFSVARSIAMERHRAIRWIWDGEPWDEVTTDT